MLKSTYRQQVQIVIADETFCHEKNNLSLCGQLAMRYVHMCMLVVSRCIATQLIYIQTAAIFESSPNE